MKVEISPLSKADEPDWDEYVRNNDQATFYHRIGWKEVIEDSYGHRSFYLTAKNGDGKICGILPLFFIRSIFFGKRVVSVPFAPYGGACTDSPGITTELVRAALSAGNEMGSADFEFRTRNCSTMEMDYTDHYVTFIMDVSGGAEPAWARMNKKVKWSVRKAIKNNLQFKIDKADAAIGDFYELYCHGMGRLGTPVHDRIFFKNLKKRFPEDVSIAEVEYAGNVISALYLLRFKDTLISGWGASLSSYFSLSPNDLIYWRSIETAAGDGLRYFDFGRSLKDSGNFRFKRAWGAAEVPLYYYHHPPKKAPRAIQDEYGSFSKIWGHLPLGLTRIVGPGLRKYIP
ncbi:MAG TPA: FemAB family XrtA/PEP-CTERM system-associated protein [Methanocella sp.]|uniref:FemAB family XrtA/PEP-CTERM system-associated protein n=1 Tax=Methanocella sp. TaxID=2052833 RepID=UPI002CF07B56|nr:FemAB family XrtA/PEP-CTERM system-associated protein [Methanocella sp.]HTY90744.1 FemAB family XrtA/PEP-CTERM system-associated protein [Methanocella sp.]